MVNSIMKGKLFKSLLSLMMAFSIFLPNLSSVINAEELIATTIMHTQTTGTTNKFTFSETGWSAMGQSDEHVWSDDPTSNPSAVWYQVDFVGSKIDIYSGKNHPMGMVEYFIDGTSIGEFSLYNGSNINSTYITTIDGLEEGPHVFKAVATGKTASGSTNDLIDCAKVIVYHAPYVVSDFTFTEANVSIVDGATYQIQVNVTPDYATADAMTYVSNNETIATVSDTGVITAKGVGSTTITCTINGVSKDLNVTVTAANAQMSGSIVDTDLHYIQSKYDEVKTLGTMSETLQAWKNDKAESEILVVAKDGALSNVKVSATDFTSGANTIASSNVELFYIESTQAYGGGFLGYASTNHVLGTNPGGSERPVPTTDMQESNDILVPMSDYENGAKDIAFNAFAPVWVRINVPKDAVAGTYTGKIIVDADEAEAPLEFAYTLEVINETLPDATTFKDTFDIDLWQYPYSVAEYYDVEPFSEEHFAILRPHMEIYKQLGATSITTTIYEDAWQGQTYSANEIHYPSMVKWTKQADGSFTYDYTAFDKWVSFCKEMGLGDTIIVYSIAPWHNAFTYWENGQVVREPYTVGNERYNTVVKNFLQDLVEHLMDKGWFDDAYIGFDERGVNQTAFDVIRSVRNIHGIPLKIQASIDSLAGKKAQALSADLLNVGDFAAETAGSLFDEIIATREAEGKKTTLYSCTEHRPGNFSLSAPVESYWSVINAGRYADGFNRWAFDAWVEDPLRNASHNAFEAGDCFSIFPDEKDAENPVSRYSVRLARMAQGVRDTNKIRFMVKAAPDLKDDVDALYGALTTVATKNTSYMNDTQKAALASEMDTFETGLQAICKQYDELLKTGSNEINGLEISDGDIEIALGTTKTLTLTFNPENLINKNVTWTSSNNSVISVDANGVVTANRLGSAMITATSVLDPTKKDSIIVKSIFVPVAQEAQVAYYSFDDETGNDAWGTRNGVVNGATYVDGKSGKAISLTETNNMTFETASPFGENDAWSIGYYVKSTEALTARHSVLMDSNKDFSFDLKMAADRKSGFHVGKNSGDVLTFEYPFEKDVWYHVMWTQSKTDGLSMYVNGTLVQTNTWTKTNKTLAPIDIVGGSGFTGYVDELKVYNRVLSEDEIQVVMMNNGLNLTDTTKDVNLGETYQIEASIIASGTLPEITYKSSDDTIASVDENGLVTAHKKGTVTIEVVAGTFKAEMTINVVKEVNITNVLDRYILDEKYQSDVEKAPGTNRQYLGQPDMVRTKSGRLITAFPQGHGKGPIVMKFSDDEGESWYEYTNTPESWLGSQETPTLYILNLADGTERIMMITACPGWGTDSDGNQYGWNTSYSDDNGETWSEYKHWYSEVAPGDANDCIVAMASLVQLKDENGNYKQEWMGNFHNYSYQNYKTILSFDENGNEQWSTPELYLDEYRDIESAYQMCEIGMFRSPDGKRIVGLARSQSHNNPSTLIYSDDEGETWSKPMHLPGSLSGERHKALYDPISGRLVITFREILFDTDGNGQFNGDWTCGEWLAWVGTYEQLMNQEDGDYVIELDEDFSSSAKSGDTGYTGMVVLEDGTFILDTYGHWDQEFSNSWSGGVTTDLCWIRQAKFKLGNVESDNYLTSYTDLYNLYQEVKDYKSSDYTGETFLPFALIRDEVATMIEARDAQQMQVDALFAEFDAAVKALEESTSTLNKDALEAAIIEANKIQAAGMDQYTENTLEVFEDALTLGKEVYTSADATQDDVSLAAKMLNNAIGNLELKPVPVVKTALIAAIDACADEIANEDAYNEESYATFKAVYDAAVVVSLNENATQEEVNNATSALREAVNGLILKGHEPVNPDNLINKAANDVTVENYSSQCGGTGEPAENGTGQAAATVDYNNNTYWHSNWDKNNGEKHTITYNLGKEYTLTDVTFLPRQAGRNGDIHKFEVYVGNSTDYTQNELTGEYVFATSGTLNPSEWYRANVALNGTYSGQYVTIRVTGCYGDSGNDQFASMAEIRFYGVEPQEGANKDALNALIATAEALNADDYTVESWNALLTFLAEAKVVANNDDATQAEVDAAKSSLQFAMDALIEKPLLPAKVENLVAEDTNYKTITLTWEASEGATEYDVYRKSYKEGATFEYEKTVNEPTYEATGVMTGKEYTFYVVAKNEAGEADASDVVAMATTLKGTVKLEMEQVSTSKFHLSWNKVDGATRYIVYRKRNDDKMKKVLTLGTNVLEYTTAEMPNGDYTFQVKAGRYDSTDRVMTGASNKVEGTVEALKPTVTATAGTKSAKISWKKMEGVTHYQVYRATSSSGKYTKLVTTKELSYTAKSLTKGKKYYFKVRGYKTYKSGTDIQYTVYTPYSSVKSATAK